MYIFLCNLLNIAASRAQGILVAPSRRILLLLTIPSSSIRNCVFTLVEDSLSLSDHLETRESISSIKIIALGCFLACLKIFLTCFSESPTYLDMMSEGETLKKAALFSVAHALAKKVFPVPGGPYKRIPVQGCLSPLKISGNFSGKTIVPFSSFFALVKPITSSHFTFGDSASYMSATWSSLSESS